MEFKHEYNSSGGRYTTAADGVVAYISYSRTSPRLIIIDHTEVPDVLRGKGIGQALAMHAVEEARSGGWKIIPLCPFFQSQLATHPDWRDVIA
ncbi:N-acetyltransferase [Ensifer adhaerens]|uniref:GNAT family N-acetyltransferase n=1 Tax=Ensifer adhaerens TaxID=106592 RepID=UPI001CBD962D|nr:GNAT family N-acetyltransferase [Ensifer adhaerens]MBZ7927738.1 N-acetyltransferase [Ensifer adhaerens]UAX96619.1 N-acetyltransferase [Ensifer adhaerens]UAY04037.1 N-acetyltransferase [Ensifer adhaerens]UAY12023.1 N-acetyltransferase [Ensifer adhaerens]